MSTMTQDQFDAALDIYGPDLRLWPSALQQPAQQLLQSSASAQAALSLAKRLDEELDASLPPAPARGLPLLKEQIMARVLASGPQTSLILRFWAWLLAGPRLMQVLLLRPAVLAMIPLIGGFLLGMSVADVGGADDDLVAEMVYMAFTDRFEGYVNGQ